MCTPVGKRAHAHVSNVMWRTSVFSVLPLCSAIRAGVYPMCPIITWCDARRNFFTFRERSTYSHGLRSVMTNDVT